MRLHNKTDDHIDDLLASYATLDNPKSFFLNAGAGAGKTRSLVNLLNNINKRSGDILKKTNKKIAVITYTKVASLEIISRTPENSMFDISTIHSYVWTLIKGHNQNIKEALLHFCNIKTKKLTDKKRLTQKQKEQLDELCLQRKHIESKEVFNYSPEGTLSEKGSLSHSDVLKIFSFLVNSNNLFRKLVCNKYPIILVDECQDTNKDIMDSFLKLNKENKICLGLFGDVMQRVYLDGKADLIKSLEGLEMPEKKVNWRSYGRIVDFTNNLRKNIDNLEQKVCTEDRVDKGLVRIYLVNNNLPRIKSEEDILSDIKDHILSNKIDNEYVPYKLVLEHRLAAERNNFLSLFDAFKSVKDTDRALDGESKEHTFLKQVIIPIYYAWKEKDDFTMHRLLKLYSYRFNELEQKRNESYEVLNKIGIDFQNLLDIFNNDITLGCLFKELAKSNLFELPTKLRDDFHEDTGWRVASNVKFAELVNFYHYLDGISGITTQQGSKGLEYTHVQVIIDDHSIKGNTFSYEKLFGVKDKSSTDIRNETEGKDTVLNKTNRLFYVACSRAIKSLVLVVYTANQQTVKEYFIRNKYARCEEIITINNL